MIQAADVYYSMSVFMDTRQYDEQDVMPCCQKGLDWVMARLQEGVDPDNPLITQTAAAMAHFYFFLCRITDPDKYENCKVGDVTYNRNIEKEFEFENRIRNQAIADAAEILKDGGFYCRGS